MAEIEYASIVNGYHVKDSEARAQLEAGARTCPILPKEKRDQLKALVNTYVNARSNFVYDGNAIRNIYKDAGAFKNGKVRVNCGLFVNLVWAGVHPSTFDVGDQFDGTLVKDEGFDWGYEFTYPYRKAYKITNGESLYGLLKPNDDKDGTDEPEDYVDASSYNTYYSPNSSRADKQWFFSYATAADMACEMYVKGYEIPMKEVNEGDILFYNARSLNDGMDDAAENHRFRNITHVGIVTYINRDSGAITVTESTSMLGSEYPIVACGPGYSSLGQVTRSIYLINHIVMAARHPAAFGKKSNVGSKFTILKEE